MKLAHECRQRALYVHIDGIGLEGGRTSRSAAKLVEVVRTKEVKRRGIVVSEKWNQ